MREIGASEVIVTDNSQTQTGKKWEATSRSVMTKQRTFVPHNQNEIKVARRIKDAKHKNITVLQRDAAPLLFWCYALIYVIDCLNHIAKKPLGWKTSSEVLNGDTADISPFRFKFWQPVKFFNKVQFPEGRWVMARFLGIAWDSGDQFTFKVWSEPDGDWSKGGEFTRNVVRARHSSEVLVESEDMPDVSQFKFQKKVRTKKRKRNGNVIFYLVDIPEIENAAETIMDESDGVMDGEQHVPSGQQSVNSPVTSANKEPVNPGGNEGDIEPTTTTPTTIKKENSSSTAEPTLESGATSEE